MVDYYPILHSRQKDAHQGCSRKPHGIRAFGKARLALCRFVTCWKARRCRHEFDPVSQIKWPGSVCLPERRAHAFANAQGQPDRRTPATQLATRHTLNNHNARFSGRQGVFAGTLLMFSNPAMQYIRVHAVIDSK